MISPHSHARPELTHVDERLSECVTVRQGDRHAPGLPRIHQSYPTSDPLVRSTEPHTCVRMWTATRSRTRRRHRRRIGSRTDRRRHARWHFLTTSMRIHHQLDQAQPITRTSVLRRSARRDHVEDTAEPSVADLIDAPNPVITQAAEKC